MRALAADRIAHGIRSVEDAEQVCFLPHREKAALAARIEAELIEAAREAEVEL